MKNENSLLLCPFCGSEANLKVETAIVGHGDSWSTYKVQCKSCLASTQAAGYTGDQPVYFMNQAVKAWNTRISLENEELRRDAERYRWLRSQDKEDFEFSVVKNPNFDVFQSSKEIDSAIDAAMRGCK